MHERIVSVRCERVLRGGAKPKGKAWQSRRTRCREVKDGNTSSIIISAKSNHSDTALGGATLHGWHRRRRRRRLSVAWHVSVCNTSQARFETRARRHKRLASFACGTTDGCNEQSVICIRLLDWNRYHHRAARGSSCGSRTTFSSSSTQRIDASTCRSSAVRSRWGRRSSACWQDAARGRSLSSFWAFEMRGRSRLAQGAALGCSALREDVVDATDDDEGVRSWLLPCFHAGCAYG